MGLQKRREADRTTLQKMSEIIKNQHTVLQRVLPLLGAILVSEDGMVTLTKAELDASPPISELAFTQDMLDNGSVVIRLVKKDETTRTQGIPSEQSRSSVPGETNHRPVGRASPSSIELRTADVRGTATVRSTQTPTRRNRTPKLGKAGVEMIMHG